MSVVLRIYPAEWQFYIPPQERDWRDVTRERASQPGSPSLPPVSAKEFFAKHFAKARRRRALERCVYN